MIRGVLGASLLWAGAAQAETAWDVFEARCLAPYENQSLAIHDDLPEQAGAEQGSMFGPTAGGFFLLLNATPDEGERTCAVLDPSGSDADTAFADWSRAVVAEGHYVEIRGGMLASNEWIEPQIHVRLRFDGGGAVYEVIETELES